MNYQFDDTSAEVLRQGQHQATGYPEAAQGILAGQPRQQPLIAGRGGRRHRGGSADGHFFAPGPDGLVAWRSDVAGNQAREILTRADRLFRWRRRAEIGFDGSNGAQEVTC